MSDSSGTGIGPIELPFERSIWFGNSLSLILYGVECTLYFYSCYLIWKLPPTQRRRRKFYIIYGGVLLILLSFAMGCDVLIGQMMWIEHRDYPGGPFTYFVDHTTIWFNTLGSAADSAGNCLADALLLYRTYMIWECRLWIIAVPFLLWLAATVFNILTVVESALPGNFLLDSFVAGFGVPWIALTVSLNVILTSLICFRLYTMRKQVLVAPGLAADMGKTYTGLMAILVESALPFTVLGIGFLVTYALDDPTDLAWGFIWGNFTAISPQMIILRIAMGQGWTRGTAAQFTTTMSFAHPDDESHVERPRSRLRNPLRRTQRETVETGTGISWAISGGQTETTDPTSTWSADVGSDGRGTTAVDSGTVAKSKRSERSLGTEGDEKDVEEKSDYSASHSGGGSANMV